MTKEEKKALFASTLKGIVIEELRFMGKVLIVCGGVCLAAIVLSKTIPD